MEDITGGVLYSARYGPEAECVYVTYPARSVKRKTFEIRSSNMKQLSV